MTTGTNPERSYKEAKYWNDHIAPAERHVRLFKRIGRKSWMETYNTPRFVRWIGKKRWANLKMNMKKIMDGEK